MVHCFPMEKKQAAARTNSEQTQYWNCHLVSRLLKLDSNVPDETVLDDLHDTFYPPDPQALEQGARIALRDPVGGTLLHRCCLLGSGPCWGDLWRLHRLLLEHLIECAGKDVLEHEFNRNASHYLELRNGDWTRVDEPRDLPYDELFYDGETALHIAVAKGDVDIVNLLLSRDVSCRSRAYGSFFAPGSDTGCYYGEYALSFAASTGRTDIVGCLLDSDPGAVYLVDSFGNTAFHLAILHARIDAYRDLIARSGQSARDVAELHGALGMTPLGFAALLRCVADSTEKEEASEDAFDQLLDSIKTVAWEFTEVVSHEFPLAQLDSIPSAAQPPPQCAPQTAGNTPDEETPADPSACCETPGDPRPVAPAWSECGNSGKGVVCKGGFSRVSSDLPLRFVSILYLVVQHDLQHLAENDLLCRLLEEKWAFVRLYYYFGMLTQFSYLGFITALTVRAHPSGEADMAWLRQTVTVITALNASASAVDVILGVIYFARLRKLRHGVQKAGVPPQLTGKKNAWLPYASKDTLIIGFTHGSTLMLFIRSYPLRIFDIIAWVGYCLYVAYLNLDGIVNRPLHDSDDVPLKLVFLGFSALCAWMSVLTFAPVHERTGMLVTMMTRTIARDLLPFLCVFCFIFTGISVTLFALQREGHSLLQVMDMLELRSMGLGEGGNGDPGGHGPGLREVCFVMVLVFTVIAMVLMLNLLIATFTSTYEEVKDSAHKEWRLQWGRDVLLLERRLSLWPSIYNRLRVNHREDGEHAFVSVKNKSRAEYRPGRHASAHGNNGRLFTQSGNDYSKYLAGSVMRGAEAAAAPPRKKKKKKPKRVRGAPDSYSSSHAGGAAGEAGGGATPAGAGLTAAVEAAMKTRCDNCGSLLSYTTSSYPVNVECPKCRAKSRIDRQPSDSAASVT